MRHLKAHRKLSKATDQRMAMLRGLVKSLIIYERVETTHARAKEARKLAERLVAVAKTDDVHSRRKVARVLGTERKVTPVERKKGIEKIDPIRKLFQTIAPSMAEREGGFTRLTRTGPRRGDGTEMAVIEFLA